MSIKFAALILFFSVSCAFAWNMPWQSTPQFNVIIHHAGDIQNPGRPLYNTTEYELSLQWAQELKEALEAIIPAIMITIIPTRGQHYAHNTLAQMANRSNAHLVVSLQCYQETQPKSQLYLYNFWTGQSGINFLPLQLVPVEQAHFLCANTTDQMVQKIMVTVDKPTYHAYFNAHGPYKLPLKTLVGIKVPALACELGITQGMSWQPIVHALAQGIKECLQGAS